MLDRAYDPTQPYCFARYGRMSDPRQNRRSPDQQFNTIDEGIARCGYPWRCVATYRDDGIRGRYLRKRPGFQRMLRDIEAGLIRIDLVVVDTLERLGRADEIAELRRRLFVEHGVLIVAADNNFSDPTGVVGKAVGLVEQIRSPENTRISRHNVLRGKKDAARLGRWPGGPPPFGYRLKPVLEEQDSGAESYSVLEIEPRAAAALRLVFERAAATGHGGLRLSQRDLAGDGCPDALMGELIDWTETPALEPCQPWSVQYAAEVADRRAAGWTHEQLAEYFGVSVPTIRKALRIAIQRGETSPTLPRKMPRPRWPEQHYQEVDQLHRQGMSLKELCQHFRRSEPLVRRALQLATERAQEARQEAGNEHGAPSPDPPGSG